MKKTIRRIITFVIVTALVCGAGYEGLVYVKKKNQKEVIVISAGELNQEVYDYGSSDSSLDGNIASNVRQKISVSEEVYIEDVFVKEGQHVKKGDLLLSYDMTLQEMEQHINELMLENNEQMLIKEEKKLESLKNGGPIEDIDSSFGGSSTISDDSDVMDIGGGDDMSDGDDDMLMGAAFRVPLLASALMEVPEELFAEPAPELFAEEAAEEAAEGEQEEESVIIEQASELEETDSYEEFDMDDLPVEEGDFADPSSGSDDSLFSDGSVDHGMDQEDNTNSLLHKSLTYSSAPYSGLGTKENPLLFLCDATDEKILADASFLNRMAGYSADGLTLENPGGYWFALHFYYPSSFWDEKAEKEFEKNLAKLDGENLDEALHQLGNSMVDTDDFTKNAVLQGYYLINGGKLVKSVPYITGRTFLLEKATFPDEEEETDDEGDMGGGIDYGGESEVNRKDAIRIQELRVETLKLTIRKLKLNISKMDKKLQKKNVYSAVDGTVVTVGDVNAANASAGAFGSDFLVVESDRGCYIEGSVSEMKLDDLQIGTIITGYSYDTGQQFEAKVTYVSDYPKDDAESDYFGMSGNQNASSYSFLADIEDPSFQMEDQSWISLSYKKDQSEGSSLNLLKAFTRTENGQTYVYKAVDGVLHKQYITVGASKDGGWSVPVISGVTFSDYLAFPYGPNAQEGIVVKEGTMDDLNAESNLVL